MLYYILIINIKFKVNEFGVDKMWLFYKFLIFLKYWYIINIIWWYFVYVCFIVEFLLYVNIDICVIG